MNLTKNTICYEIMVGKGDVPLQVLIQTGQIILGMVIIGKRFAAARLVDNLWYVAAFPLMDKCLPGLFAMPHR